MHYGKSADNQDMKGIRLFLTIICFSLVSSAFADAPSAAQSEPSRGTPAASASASKPAQTITYRGSGGYSLVERTNLRRYDNGKYVGLLSREVRSFISPAKAPAKILANKNDPLSKSRWYDGSFYVLEETRRNMQSAAAGIHDSIPSEFAISPEGKVTMYRDNGYPSFRSFPAFPSSHLSPGDTWTASAVRSVDPLNKGKFTRMPMDVVYTFAGEEIYKGNEVFRIHASWKNKYSQMEGDPLGDTTLSRSAGSHKAEVIVLKATGEAILVTDQVDETFSYTDGKNITFKGTIILFTEFPPAVDTEKIMPVLQRIATVAPEASAEKVPQPVNTSEWLPERGNYKGDPDAYPKGKSAVASSSSAIAQAVEKPKNNMVVEKTEAGLRLSVRDIRFEADSDKIRDTESKRLDEIAEVLRLAPKSHFLIEGHTASVGRPEGEQTLSVQRAHAIAEELAKRGVPAAAFICRGWGGTRPVASNETEEGRAQNRRVEITILE